MKPLRLLRRNFEHGAHPAHHKEQTEDLAIQRVPFGKHYVMPLGQHIGVPARAVVTEGQRLQRGQLIAEPGGFVSTALHSPVTGTVTRIGDFRGVDGRFAPAIGKVAVAASVMGFSRSKRRWSGRTMRCATHCTWSSSSKTNSVSLSLPLYSA